MKCWMKEERGDETVNETVDKIVDETVGETVNETLNETGDVNNWWSRRVSETGDIFGVLAWNIRLVALKRDSMYNYNIFDYNMFVWLR